MRRPRLRGTKLSLYREKNALHAMEQDHERIGRELELKDEEEAELRSFVAFLTQKVSQLEQQVATIGWEKVELAAVVDLRDRRVKEMTRRNLVRACMFFYIKCIMLFKLRLDLLCTACFLCH